MRVLHGCLRNVLVVEFHQIEVTGAEQVHALAHSNRVLFQRGEDTINESHLPGLMPKLKLRPDGSYVFGVIDEEIEDSGFCDLL